MIQELIFKEYRTNYGDPEAIEYSAPVYSSPPTKEMIETPFTFNGSLRDYQEEAISKWEKNGHKKKIFNIMILSS